MGSENVRRGGLKRKGEAEKHCKFFAL